MEHVEFKNSKYQLFVLRYFSIMFSILIGLIVGFELMGCANEYLTPLITAERGYEAIGGEYLLYGVILAVSTGLVYAVCRIIFRLLYNIHSR